MENEFLLPTQFSTEKNIIVTLGLKITSFYEPQMLIYSIRESGHHQHISFTESEWCRFAFLNRNPLFDYFTSTTTTTTTTTSSKKPPPPQEQRSTSNSTNEKLSSSSSSLNKFTSDSPAATSITFEPLSDRYNSLLIKKVSSSSSPQEEQKIIEINNKFHLDKDIFDVLFSLFDSINFYFCFLLKYSVYAQYQHQRLIYFFLFCEHHFPHFTIRTIPNSLLKEHPYFTLNLHSFDSSLLNLLDSELRLFGENFILEQLEKIKTHSSLNNYELWMRIY